jgi:hypothetical protein
MIDGLKEHYDQTRKHVQRVQHFMCAFAKALLERAMLHDESKYDPEEAEHFARVLPRLNSTTYGSEEYRAALREIKPAIDHHHKANSHHPEHYENGIEGMDLLDFVEMFCDWRAAIERHADGNIEQSNAHNFVDGPRFKLSCQTISLLQNSIRWIEGVA